MKNKKLLNKFYLITNWGTGKIYAQVDIEKYGVNSEFIKKICIRICKR